MRFILTLAAALSLTGCSKKEADAPPPKVVAHHIEARVTGIDLNGMTATLILSDRRDFINGGVRRTLLTEAYTSSISKTVDLGNYGAADLISGEVNFQSVTPSGNIQPRATTRLKLELLADGVVKETTELNQTKAGWKINLSPYLTGKVDVETDNL